MRTKTRKEQKEQKQKQKEVISYSAFFELLIPLITLHLIEHLHFFVIFTSLTFYLLVLITYLTSSHISAFQTSKTITNDYITRIDGRQNVQQ